MSLKEHLAKRASRFGNLSNMKLRHLAFLVIFLLLLAVAIIGCAPSTTTPTQPILVDSFFSGYAYLDTNGNGQIDSKDTPVANAALYVEMNGVKAFIEATDDKGYAFIIIPGGVEYPINVGMEAPKDSTLKLITPSEVTVSTSGSVEFLFSSK